MPVGNLPGWQQVYADDFSATTLNTWTAWSVYNNGAPGSNPNTGWWMASHAIVSNNMLTLRGAVDPAASPDGRVVTAGLGLWKLPAQTYGKYEILARIDQCPDVKYAWLLWPYSGKWPDDGEIDFAEDEGGSRTTTTASLLYKNALGLSDALPKDRISPTPDFSGWHRIGVEWTPTSVRYTLDGAYWGQPKTTEIPHNPMTLVLQTEGKLAPSAVTLGSGTCNAQIDWVVQYKMG
jgi:beta-glucanase (GH16 family)